MSTAAAASKKKKAPAKKSSAEPRFATYARAIHKQRFGNALMIWAPAVTNLDELACYPPMRSASRRRRCWTCGHVNAVARRRGGRVRAVPDRRGQGRRHQAGEAAVAKWRGGAAGDEGQEEA